ncbi:probable hexosyltransferase MUCI70 [Vigna umbellata]|uniref:probable hexosyltransferase MUCI70 n=1 Tax=Vigna umbellata TaxID=87088 RepID=UPI001F5EB541|nr:probable hexosyltransferase MUCI70 [Vigna umbellata]XP_047157134.1 probable hexosyltransferase MUCI70 [Vigna umbellata]
MSAPLGIGIRSGSYGSLDKQVQNGSARKATKMLKEKEKERLFLWICKFAGRKKVGMLFLCLISAAVFIWVLYVGKGEDSQEGNTVPSISDNESMSASDSKSEISRKNAMDLTTKLSSPPPGYFLGYNLPPGHPCNSFTLPPPPADKKRTGPRPCPVCYLPVEEAIGLVPKLPSPSPVLRNLTYVYEENLSRDREFGGSEFGGYPTLKQRNDSFDIRESMSVHCGFLRGIKPGRKTGFDMDEADLFEMEQCNGVVVASAIFGNFDEINEPKNISDYSRKTVCFLMFVDEETEKYLSSSGKLGSSKKIGLWRIIVARNLPYADARRTGKIPKLLLHRMVPNARYSIWLDGKLELVVDPYQILERFLWRNNATFAISKHYRRFDVFVEAEANKAAGKYENASIDFQIEFYKREGLTPYTEAKLPLISDVPEGCVIVREHVPISNLFTCLWFNEVDRFTSRDQLSFSTVRDKILSRVDFHFHMFLDCERRNFVVQKYHRDLLLRLAPPDTFGHSSPPPPYPPPLHVLETSPEKGANSSIKRGPGRRGKDRKAGQRRHRKVAAGSREMEPS